MYELRFTTSLQLFILKLIKQASSLGLAKALTPLK
jgi:hypothetical protein